jgi:hypothetical protein
MVDEPKDELQRTKAFGCSCASHEQAFCAYFRMGYCSDRVHGVQPAKFKKPTLVVDNANVVVLRPKQ